MRIVTALVAAVLAFSPVMVSAASAATHHGHKHHAHHHHHRLAHRSVAH